MRLYNLFSPPSKGDFPHGRRKGCINIMQVLVGQRNAKAAVVFFHVSHIAGLGNSHYARAAHHPCKHHLHWRGIMP